MFCVQDLGMLLTGHRGRLVQVFPRVLTRMRRLRTSRRTFTIQCPQDGVEDLAHHLGPTLRTHHSVAVVWPDVSSRTLCPRAFQERA